jgi:hypothetical protein
MKRAVATLSLALLVVPALALADDGPPPPAPEGAAQNTQIRSEMHQLRAQVEQMHQQARAQMLGSLSAAHRQLLANVVGQLAIAATPDREAAARQLNAALSSGEQQSIVRIHQNLRTQSKALMQNARAQMQAANPSGAGTNGMQQHPNGPVPNMQRPPQDAGHILLGMGSMHGGMDMLRGPGPGQGAPGSSFHPN